MTTTKKGDYLLFIRFQKMRYVLRQLPGYTAKEAVQTAKAEQQWRTEHRVKHTKPVVELARIVWTGEK